MKSLKSLFIIISAVLPLLSNADDIVSDMSPNVDDTQNVFQLKSDETRKAKALSEYAEALRELSKSSKINIKKAFEFIEILKDDPSAEIPLAFVIAAWNQDRKKSGKLVTELYMIAQKNSAILKLNIAAATMLLNSKKDKEACELLENTLTKNEEKIYSVTPDKTFVNLFEILLSLYQKNKDFDKGDSLLKKLFRDSSTYKNDFNILRSAAIFYKAAATVSDSAPFLLIFQSDKEHYLEEYDKIFARIEKLCFEKYHGPEEMAPLIDLCKIEKNLERAKYLVLCNLLSDPLDPETLELLAFIYMDKNEDENAFRIFKYLDRMNYLADRPHIYLELARSAIKSNKLKDAADALEWYSTISGENPEIYYMMALVYLDMGLYRKAIARLEKAPKSFKTYNLKSLCERKLGRHKNALSSLLLAEAAAPSEKKDPLNREFYFILAYVADKAGDMDEVETALNKILSRSPEDHEALNFLGYTWADKGINLDKAERLIASALASDSKNTAYLDSMAWVLFKKGNIKESVKYIDKAISEEGDSIDPVILDHAGDIYWADGQKEKAIKFWKEAAGTYSEDLDPEIVLRKIRKTEPGN